MIRAQAGVAFEALAGDAAAGLVGTITVEVYDPTNGATILAARTSGITEPRPGTYRVALTVATAGTYAVRWVTPSAAADEELLVTDLPVSLGGATFATVADLAQRLGRTFTAQEEAQAEMLLGLASSAIAAACDKPDQWIAELVPVPPAVRVVCIEAAVRVMVNPEGVRSRQEMLGAYQHSESFHAYFDPAAAGVHLTDAEILRVRRAVYGSSSGSANLPSIIADCCTEEPCPAS